MAGRRGRPVTSVRPLEEVRGVEAKVSATARAHEAPSLVGQAGPGILLVDDHRHAAATRGKVGGRGDVAAEADDDVRTDALDRSLRRAHGPGETAREHDEVRAGTAGQGHARHVRQGVPGLGDQPVLQTLLGAQDQDLHLLAGGVRAGPGGCAERPRWPGAG